MSKEIPRQTIDQIVKVAGDKGQSVSTIISLNLRMLQLSSKI